MSSVRSKDDAQFVQAWEDLEGRVHSNAVRAGWWDEDRNDGELIALMHSELSEALEVLRKNPDAPDPNLPDYKAVEVELADVVLRIMDYAAARGLVLSGAIVEKHEYNTTRPHRHGNKRF